jgi:hypothetical protein
MGRAAPQASALAFLRRSARRRIDGVSFKPLRIGPMAVLLTAVAAGGCTLPYGEVFRPGFWEKPAPREVASDQPLTAAPQPAPAPPAIIRPAEREANLAARFAVLDQLLDRRLITGDEHERRRPVDPAALPANGAVMTNARLGQPPPSAAAVAGRLDAIGRSLRTGEISSEEHSAERTAILEALLPAAAPAPISAAPASASAPVPAPTTTAPMPLFPEADKTS